MSDQMVWHFFCLNENDDINKTHQKMNFAIKSFLNEVKFHLSYNRDIDNKLIKIII